MMNAPRGGLRPVHNKRNDVAKVELRVPAGGTIAAQDDVVAQLLGTGDFAEGAAPVALLDALDSRVIEIEFQAEPTTAAAVDAVVVKTARPAKKAAPKS